PEEANPASTAAERNSPETRGSRATTARGRVPSAACPWPSTTAAAWERCSARSAVSSPLATPRTPSVPKILVILDVSLIGQRRICPAHRRGGANSILICNDQRLEYCGALRAFFRPAFLRSTARSSRVRNPAFFSAGRL